MTIKIKCNNKDIYNLLIQDVRIERIGHGFVVTVNTHPSNACLLFHTHDNRMYIISYMDEFDCFIEFPTNVTKYIVESYTYKDVITLRGNPYGDLMDVSLEFSD